MRHFPARHCRFLLLLVLFLPVNAFCVELKATITYANTSSRPVKNIIHRLTIPPDTLYQKVTGLETVNIDDTYQIKNHATGSDTYISFKVDIEPHSTTTGSVVFLIQHQELTFSPKEIVPVTVAGELPAFLEPSENIESDAREIKAVVQRIADEISSLGEQIVQAYRFPDDSLQYREQKATTALTALQTGKGDCTEFAYLFVALGRNLGVPARPIYGFFFAEKNTFPIPNHVAAEIYLEGRGWVPVYPNLGNSKYREQFGFGKTSDRFITLKRSEVWTWSNRFPRKYKDVSDTIKAEVFWEVHDETEPQ